MSTNINDLEEKKLIFGTMQYIYWEVDIDSVTYTITAFNNMSLMFHLANNQGIDAVLFPKLTDADYSTVKKLFNIVIELVEQSAKTYQGDKNLFTAYFLLQPYVGDMDEDLEGIQKKGVEVNTIGDTKTGGTSFRKYSIEIDTKKL